MLPLCSGQPPLVLALLLLFLGASLARPSYASSSSVAAVYPPPVVVSITDIISTRSPPPCCTRPNFAGVGTLLGGRERARNRGSEQNDFQGKYTYFLIVYLFKFRHPLTTHQRRSSFSAVSSLSISETAAAATTAAAQSMSLSREWIARGVLRRRLLCLVLWVWLHILAFGRSLDLSESRFEASCLRPRLFCRNLGPPLR